MEKLSCCIWIGSNSPWAFITVWPWWLDKCIGIYVFTCKYLCKWIPCVPQIARNPSLIYASMSTTSLWWILFPRISCPEPCSDLISCMMVYCTEWLSCCIYFPTKNPQLPPLRNTSKEHTTVAFPRDMCPTHCSIDGIVVPSAIQSQHFNDLSGDKCFLFFQLLFAVHHESPP